MLDTSVLVDGRVAEVAAVGFLEGPLWVPHFVLKELQHFADSQDPLRRAKGRRGLETLERLREAAPSRSWRRPPRGSPWTRSSSSWPGTSGRPGHQRPRPPADGPDLRGEGPLHPGPGPGPKAPAPGGGHPEASHPQGGEGAPPGGGLPGGRLHGGGGRGSRYRGQEIEVVVTQAIQTQVGRLFFARPAQGAQ